MRVGIVGAGAMARALGGRWVAAGHEVVIGARSTAKAISVADVIGARSGTPADAAAADVVLLAVYHAGVDEALRQAGADSGRLTGKVLIDCTNPVELHRFTIDLPDGVASMAEHVAAISGARVVKAFNMCDATVWADPAGLGSSGGLSVMFAADDDVAGEVVTRLITDLGHRGAGRRPGPRTLPRGGRRARDLAAQSRRATRVGAELDTRQPAGCPGQREGSVVVILVTGASGNVGTEVTRAVLAAGHPVRALSRQSSAEGIPAGAEIASGDLNDRSSLRPAFAGVDAVFLLAGYPDVAGLLADMRAAGAGRVVLLSTGAVIGGDLDNGVVRFNVVSEAAVRDSGLDWTVLRPSGFMSNTLQWIPQLRAGDVVREPFADVPIATIDPFDIAAVAALTLTSDGHNQRSYRLTGPESLLPADRAGILGGVLGRDLRIVAEPDDHARRRMGESMPDTLVDAFFQFFRRGGYDDSHVDDTAARLLDRPPRTFRDWSLAHAGAFR
jgi:uncharacterized protein YbjT (DUF2867 family)